MREERTDREQFGHFCIVHHTAGQIGVEVKNSPQCVLPEARILGFAVCGVIAGSRSS